MIVVVIMAILATLATYGVRGYIRISRTAEVTGVVQSIRGAQEAYREDTFTYLDVSDGSFDNRYPVGAPSGTTKFAWGDRGSTQGKRFAALGVQTSGPVMFGYACVAGGADTIPSAPDDVSKTFNWEGNKSAEPWYVIEAVGDQDDDEKTSKFVASSFTNGLYIENRME
jgi:type II secretory pathway pseudopilin PulG